MTAKSDYLEAAILNHVLRNTALTSPTTVYVGLSTAAILDDASGLAEPSGGSYAREAITFDAPSSGVCNNNEVTFTQATADWGTLTHFGIFDAVSGGNLLYHGALTASKAIDSGDTGIFADDSLTVEER